jgi:hypothetical protein
LPYEALYGELRIRLAMRLLIRRNSAKPCCEGEGGACRQAISTPISLRQREQRKACFGAIQGRQPPGIKAGMTPLPAPSSISVVMKMVEQSDSMQRSLSLARPPRSGLQAILPGPMPLTDESCDNYLDRAGEKVRRQQLVFRSKRPIAADPPWWPGWRDHL